MSSSRLHRLGACLAAALLVGAAHAAGEVRVRFVEPERFVDIGFTPADRQRVLDGLERHLQEWGRRHLGDGQSLAVDVLDVDLAGEERPGPRDSVRVLLGSADWPRIHLRYVLQAAGRPIAQGEEKLADMDYLGRRTSVHGNEPLFFERRLLDEWLAERIEPALAGAR